MTRLVLLWVLVLPENTLVPIYPDNPQTNFHFHSAANIHCLRIGLRSLFSLVGDGGEGIKASSAGGMCSMFGNELILVVVHDY